MKKTLTIISTIVFTFLAINSIAKAEIKVVTSIKPIHSLTSYVMDGVGKPDIIVDGYNSPHNFSLKPSHAKMIEKANLIIWVGEDLETFLEKPLKTISKDAVNVEIMGLKGIKKLKFREKNIFEGHDDHEHGHKEHKEHGHDEHKEHGHKEKKHDDHGHEGHAHGEHDPHVWLDPINAKAIVHEIEEALVKADPKHASTYEANAHEMMEKLDKLTAELQEELEPFHKKGFIVFHDAYQYFEQRFDLAAIGSITVSPEVMPGAERVSELREKILELNATCVFSEPQFEPKLVETLVEGTGARTGVLDPLGATLAKGPDLYFQLLRNMASSLKKCLSGKS